MDFTKFRFCFKQGIFFTLVCFIFACGKPKTELSMPEEKFIKILADAHLIESAIQNNNAKFRDSMTVVYYNQLYEIHGTSEEEFRLNIKALESDPKMLSEIYAKVMDELSKMEADNK